MDMTQILRLQHVFILCDKKERKLVLIINKTVTSFSELRLGAACKIFLVDRGGSRLG